MVSEGYVLNGIFYRRFSQNKNILAATCGPSGSGKSWADLSIVENWYKNNFNEGYNIDDCCFSLEALMNRLVHGKLKKGSILILEEAGVNLGSLDFQTKIAKTFNYVLQSFRSMNVGIIVNLPYFSMLNKNARMLMHLIIEPIEINKTEKRVTLNVKQLQFAQESGKMYQHKPKILIDGFYEKIDSISYSAPSEELIKSYEAKKKKFVEELAKEVLETAQNGDKKPLTELQEKILNLWRDGVTRQVDIAAKLGKKQGDISLNEGYMRRKGYPKEKYVQK